MSESLETGMVPFVPNQGEEEDVEEEKEEIPVS